jgi:hypothetical protein
MRYLIIVLGLLIYSDSYSQEVAYNSFYRDRADVMFKKVWDNYRLKQYPGLFTENYPSGKNVSLDYFQGAQVAEKPVSFLWPFSGMFSAANVLICFPDLKK